MHRETSDRMGRSGALPRRYSTALRDAVVAFRDTTGRVCYRLADTDMHTHILKCMLLSVQYRTHVFLCTFCTGNARTCMLAYIRSWHGGIGSCRLSGKNDDDDDDPSKAVNSSDCS